MVGVTKISGKSGAGYATYLTDLGKAGDYYVTADGQSGEPPGVWLGMTAEELAEIGVDSESGVSKEELESLMAGIDPITGAELRKVGPDGTRVAAIDITWSVPKSVSAVWAMAEPEMRAAIEREFYAAVAEGIDYVGHELEIVRERAGGRGQRHVRAAGVAAAAFMHSTSRTTGSEEDGVPDPQLHLHVLLLGAKRQDGTFAAIDSRAIMQAHWAVDATVMGSLAGRLERTLGYAVERTTDGKGGVKWELAGVDPALIKAWSRRTGDIDALKAAFRLENKRNPSAKEVRVMSLASRGKKTAMPKADRFKVWQAKGSRFEKGGAAGQPAGALSVADRAAQFRLELLQALTREYAIVDKLKLADVAAVLAQGLLVPSEMRAELAAMKESGDLLELADGRVTTKENRALEVAAMAAAGRLVARKGGVAMSEQTLGAIVASVEMQRGLALSAQQRAALTSVMAEGGLTVVVGQAGTGKGFVMAVAARAWQAQGREVIGMAVAGKRAVALQSEWGIGNTMNLAQMASWLKTGQLQLTPGHVIVVDEAGMADHHHIAGVLAAADESGAKLVLVGDHRQLQAIGPGGLFRAVAKVAPTVELTEIHRAKDVDERSAWKAIRDGRAAEGLAYYSKQGRLHLYDTREEAYAAMAAAWNEARKGLKPSEILMITDSSNRDRDSLNLLAQSYRIEAGELGAERVKVGASAEVWAHAGDHIMVRKITHLGPGQQRIENGVLGEVVGVDPDNGALTLRTEEVPARTVTLRGEQLEGCELAAAVHVYKGIGETVTRTMVSIGGWQTDQEKAYTALSRSTDQTDIFISRDDLDEEGIGSDNVDAAVAELAKRMKKSRGKEASIEYQLAAHESHVRRGRFGAAVRKILATLRPAAIDHDRQARGDEDLRLDRLEHRRRGPARAEIVQERVMMEMDEGIGGLRVVGRGEGIMEPSLRLVERTEPLSSTTAPVTPTVEPATPTPAPVEPVTVTPAAAPVEPVGLKIVQPHRPPKTGGVR